jgi:hypothetical protein
MDNRIAPAEKLVSVTPSDTVNTTLPLRAIYVGVTGNVKILDMAGSTITLVGLAAGIFHPVCAMRVFSTDTTATSIVGVY